MTQALPLSVRAAARRFSKTRADYYDYLADVIEGSEGSIKFQQIFERDAERYAKKPRGIVSRYWSEVFLENGADLSVTWNGQLPEDELALIAVAQNSGEGAIITTLRDLAAGARLKKEISKKTLATMLIAGFGLSVALLMALVYPPLIAPMMQSSFGMVPEIYWRPIAKVWFGYAEAMQSWLPVIALAIAFFVIFTKWSVNNLIGGFRNKLDKDNFFYSTIRDVRAVMFLTTLATISKQRGSSSMTLKRALSMFDNSTKSPWFSWRIRELIENIEASGGVSSEIFNTGIVSEEVYYYLRDMQESRGFTEGLNQTAMYVKEKLLARISLKLNVYMYVILAIAGITVFAVTTTQMAVIRSMAEAMKAFYSS